MLLSAIKRMKSKLALFAKQNFFSKERRLLSQLLALTDIKRFGIATRMQYLMCVCHLATNLNAGFLQTLILYRISFTSIKEWLCRQQHGRKMVTERPWKLGDKSCKDLKTRLKILKYNKTWPGVINGGFIKLTEPAFCQVVS